MARGLHADDAPAKGAGVEVVGSTRTTSSPGRCPQTGTDGKGGVEQCVLGAGHGGMHAVKERP